MTIHNKTTVSELEQKIASAWSEANAWKGKPTEHYRMGCILAESLEKQLSELLKKQSTENQAGDQ